ncbi:MAG: type IX secretion system protein PorQ [Bacteroidia bacterium]|nr:type IX secretion system protein PorQ [Bacteroidia bacterium]MDW8303044.1 type IX secretion system protein PorQ [Bacteroidia bacterium]
MIQKWFLLVLCIASWSIKAQVGGRGVFQVLNLVPNARMSALGGYGITLYDNDVNTTYQNPALINSSMKNRLGISYINSFADINYGYTGYAHEFKKIGLVAGGVQYINYGKFIEANEFGEKTGTFTANDVVLSAGTARHYKEKFHFGANLKLIYSGIAQYSSTGFATDWAGVYQNDSLNITGAVVIRNLGLQINPYVPGGVREKLPFEIQAGFSHRLRHLPFRFMFNFIHLETPNLAAIDPNAPKKYDISGNEIKPRISLADKIFRHVVIGGEFYVGKFVQLRFGYNHLRRRELAVETAKGLSGFSFGAGLKIAMFNIDYGFASYNVAGATNTFSLTVDVAKLSKKTQN